jgi:hypothetical protein
MLTTETNIPIESIEVNTQSSSEFVVKVENDKPQIQYKYLSEIINIFNLISSPLTEEQKEQGGIRVYLVKAPMGSGKSYIVSSLTNRYNKDNVFVAQLMVYKKSIDDITEDTKTVEYLKLFTEKAIREGIAKPSKYAHIQTYTKRFFDVYAEGLIESNLEELPAEGFDPYNIIEHYLKDKVLFIDECDYIINMLASFTTTIMREHQNTRDWEYKNQLLLKAAKQFYLEIAKKAKAIVLFTATTTSEFMRLLPSSTIVIDPTDYLEEGEAIRSISIASVTYLPFIEWKFGINKGYLSEKIILDITKRFSWDKCMQFSPNIRGRHIENFIKDYKVGILAPPNKLNEKARAFCNPTKQTIEKIHLGNKAKAFLIDISDFDTQDEALVSLHTALNDDYVMGVDVILITGSNARGANITKEYEDVLVITDAPWNAEVIQALGRFRNARIHAYILDRRISDRVYNSRGFAQLKAINKDRMDDGDSPLKKSDLERSSATWWKKNSSSIYYYWLDRSKKLSNPELEVERIESLINEIEDFDFTLGHSMTNWNIGVDLTYCHPDFRPSLKGETVGKAKKELGETDKAKKIIQFLKANTGITQVSLINKWKETYSNDKVLSSATITKWNKLIKEGKV